METWFATCDPGKPLGSGAGTVHALLAAWKASDEPDFYRWLRKDRRLLIHAGGQSRRLPAYAAVSKALMPIPALRGSTGQAPDQALVDLQVHEYDELFSQAPDCFRVMIVAGDALLRPEKWPTNFPQADVVCMALRSDAETAQHFGGFFVSISNPGELEFVIQKPDPTVSRKLAQNYDCLLDAGVWLLNEAAVRVLFEKCGVADPTANIELNDYDLYSEFGTCLGTNPKQFDPSISSLKTFAIPVPGEFLHFGTSRQLIESVTRLHDQTHLSMPLGFLSSSKRRTHQHVQNSAIQSLTLPENEPVWIENSFIPEGWSLGGQNFVTNVPPNDWTISLPKGICVDFVPVGDLDFCLRLYGMDDAFKGSLATTEFLGRPFRNWASVRGIEIDGNDIQFQPIFPVLSPTADFAEWIDWMVAEAPTHSLTSIWKNSARLSASELLAKANVTRVYRQRRELLVKSLGSMQQNHRSSVFYSLDLERTAEIIHESSPRFEPKSIEPGESLVKVMHDRMFVSTLRRHQRMPDWESIGAEAFTVLRDAILNSEIPMSAPHCRVATDQIVWGRAPLRFDLAGGWTDTPPYCLLNGGHVLNVAVNLNGQPPVQVFLRRSNSLDIRLRSIDLGTEHRISTYDELSGNLTEKSEFSLAQAALKLAGFDSKTGEPDLRSCLARFGGGIEMSLVAAVPKGSGLGTSSILASTILGALSEFCGLGWHLQDVMTRTLALEQILGTGGGWQDQAGGCYPGIKELQTQPGLIQTPNCLWLPDRILGPETANSVALLYYTGITRVAKSVLAEIVRGMFLNSGPRLDTLHRIGENVRPASDAIRRGDLSALGAAVHKSWLLNQELDSGTNPPGVQSILAQVEDYLLGAKLLGAGGGGFLFMIAKDRAAAARTRDILTANPPSANARFFDFDVSPVGLAVSKS